jgi:hypothetical protein
MITIPVRTNLRNNICRITNLKDATAASASKVATSGQTWRRL